MAEQHDDLNAVVAILKEPVRIAPDLANRVMSEIDRLPGPAAEPSARSPFSWVRRRWTIRVSPLGALALAAGLVGLVLAGSRLAAPGAAPEATPEPGEVTSVHLTQFVLVAPDANSVTVVGDFNDWNPSTTPLVHADGNGMWWVTVALPPGRYRYAFVVDGRIWLPDPEVPAVEEEFGRPNSVLTIGGA